ncbi:MAG TPA: protein kinase, partial [Pirellulaceae bacterium]|nr:protein kinase [Pirellulaceae bacterium]
MLRKGEQPIPGYRLERQRGKGQFGVVWEATGPGGTKAALKFVDLEGRAGSKEFQAIQRVKTLRHVNLMPIQAIWLLDEEFHPLDDNVFEKMAAAAQDALRGTMSVAVNKPAWLVIAMPLADMSVADRLKQCRQQGLPGIPPDELIQYMEDTARALDFLNSTQHDMGEGPVSIQHADIKPDNLMLVSGAVQVCDMSLARTLKLGDSIAKTQSGMQGSIAYISPEAIRGTWNSRSDQYSLAISYFEMRTGELPFDSEMPLEVIGAHVEGRLNLSLLPEAEQAVVAQAASRDAEERFATCGEFVRQLRRALADEPDSSIRVSTGGVKSSSAKTDVGAKQTEKSPKNARRSTVPGGKSTSVKSSSGKVAGSTGEAVGHDDEFDGGEQSAPRSWTKLLVVVVLLVVVGGAIAWATVPAVREKVTQLIGGGDSGSGDQGGGTAGGGGGGANSGGESDGRGGSGDKNADGGSSGKSAGGTSGGAKPGETPADGMADKSSNGKGSNDKGATTKGTGDQPPSKSKKFDAELVVVPAKAKVKFVAVNGRDVENGLEQASGEGGRVTFSFDAPDDATKIELEVAADDDTYETQTVPTSAGQLAAGKLKVVLERTVAFWLQ